MDLFFHRFDPFADFRFTNAISNINFFVIRCDANADLDALVGPDVALRSDPKLPAVSDTAPGQRLCL